MSKKQLSPPADSLHATLRVLCAGVALGLVVAACSKDSPDPQRASSPAPAASPRFEPSFDVKALQKMSSTIVATGIATKYDAYFDQRQLSAIVEERQAASSVEHGEYLYMGARLMQYTGVALPGAPDSTAGLIELKFDLQGRVVSARSLEDGGRHVDQWQIDALRARAELLRSHALAQRSINAHQQTEEARG
jgi:hypothetical protein